MISSSFLSTFWVLLCSTAVGYLKNWVEIIWSKWGANHLMVCQFFFFFVLQNSWWGLGNEPPQWVICRWMPAYLMRFSCSVKSLHKLYMHEPPQHSLARLSWCRAGAFTLQRAQRLSWILTIPTLLPTCCKPCGGLHSLIRVLFHFREDCQLQLRVWVTETVVSQERIRSEKSRCTVYYRGFRICIW